MDIYFIVRKDLTLNTKFSFKWIIGFYLIFICQFAFTQFDCKVLKPEISLIYKGECKNGLAHGLGEASGIDNYEGKFKKGLPHGNGKYEWADGDVYEGNWKKGLRHGYGKFSFFINGKDSIIEGQWVSDEFKGQKIQSDYKIVRKLSVDRYRIHKTSEGAAVYFKILRGGTHNREIENLILSSDSGTEVRQGTILGYENLIFPVTVKIFYYAWNKLHTVQYNSIFEVTFNKPGVYEVSLFN